MKWLVLFLLLPLAGFAQVDSVQRNDSIPYDDYSLQHDSVQHYDSAQLPYDAVRFVDAVGYTLSQPVRWKKKNVLQFAGVIAGAVLVSTIDEPFNNFWQRQNSPILDGIERVGFHYGKPYSATFFTSSFYLSGLLFKNEWSREMGIRLGVVLLTAGGIQSFLKTAVGRARPGTEVGAYTFKPFDKTAAYHSFPSGHTAVAWAISMTVAKYTKSVPVKILFYSLAGTTVIARLYTGAHWLSDVTFGGALTWFCSDVAFDRLIKNKFKPKKEGSLTSWTIVPTPRGFSMGVRF